MPLWWDFWFVDPQFFKYFRADAGSINHNMKCPAAKNKPENNTCPATLIEFYSLGNPRLWREFAWEILQSLSFPFSSSKSVVTSRHALSNLPFRCLDKDCFVISPWNRMSAVKILMEPISSSGAVAGQLFELFPHFDCFARKCLVL